MATAPERCRSRHLGPFCFGSVAIAALDPLLQPGTSSAGNPIGCGKPRDAEECEAIEPVGAGHGAKRYQHAGDQCGRAHDEVALQRLIEQPLHDT